MDQDKDVIEYENWSLRRKQSWKRHYNETETEKESSQFWLWAEFKSFCAATTAHGYCQLARNDNKKRTLCWIVILIIVISANIVHFKNIVSRYLQYNTQDMFTSKLSMDIALPSITVCNLKSRSISKLEETLKNKTSLMSLWKMELDGRLKQDLLGKNSTRKSRNLYYYFETPEAYFINSNEKETNFVGSKRNDFLISCLTQNKKCNDNLTTLFQHPRFYNCYTVNTKRNKNDPVARQKSPGPANGISMVLYLENDGDEDSAGTYYQNSNTQNSAGVYIVIHPSRSYPSLQDAGVEIPPGTSSQVSFWIRKRRRLKPPHGTCTPQKNLLINGKAYSYDTNICQFVCQQNHILKKCGCCSPGLPSSKKGLKMCGKFIGTKLTYKELYEEKSCEERATKEFFRKKMIEKCPCFSRCRSTEYYIEVSRSNWPLYWYQEDFYRKYILELKNDNRARLNSKHIPLDKIRDTDFIHKNFLRVNVFLKDLTVVTASEKPSVEPENLFANFGGSMGLWVGISILTVFEFFDFGFRIGYKLFCKLCGRK